MTYEERQERIEEFRIETERYQWYPEIAVIGKEFIEYINKTNNNLPTNLPTENWYLGQLATILKVLDKPENWVDEDFRIIEIITQPHYWYTPISAPSYTTYYFEITFFTNYLQNVLSKNNFSIILKNWKKLNLDENLLIKGILTYGSDASWYHNNNELSNLGSYILNLAKKDFNSIHNFFNTDTDFRLFKLWINHTNFNEDIFDKFLNIRKDRDGYDEISVFSVQALLEINPEEYLPFIQSKFKEIKSATCMLNINNLLSKFFRNSDKSSEIEKILQYLDRIKIEMKHRGVNFYKYDHYLTEEGKYVNFFELSIEQLLILDPTNQKEYLIDLFEKCSSPNHKQMILSKLAGTYKEQILPSLFSEKGQVLISVWGADDYYKTVFKLLQTIDYQQYESKVWEFTKNKSKKIREMAAITLSKLGERIIPEASKLLNDKKGEVRQIGALVLSLIKTDESQRILLEALDNEKNDDARDVILESLSGILPVPKTEEELKERIEKAQKRGKLDSPIEKWLDESQLPSLNWLSGKAFTATEIRYLFYRQSRTKDIRIDSEAKPMLALIDKSTSHDFASALLKTYFTNGADAKQKYCLGLGAILGDDDECNSLKSKVTQWADAGRGKMAEYAVKALALNGSTKALRAVEFFSRKYKNKNKNIGAAANEAFVIVAEDLNISPYELADSIIPDFGFDGLFKEFEVNGETYRAFIDNDFKLAYLNEDNKVLKSLPKATTNELKEEFKEIGKEIKDIVKSQSSRLEQYLVIQRKWNTEKWQAFFMGNPVMFAYAVRLIWGTYDADNQLIDTFRCQEDQTLINAEGDEIELPEDAQIGMVHPISLTAEQITYWTENLYDDDIQPIFPQLTRPVITLNDKDKNLKISREFQGVQYGGYGFISKMEKIGWNRGSVVDGGWISSYFKDFSDLGFTAIITQQGELCVGYYDGNAELNELMFVRKKAVQFGSYIYDEPSNENDERLMAFGEVPAIIYSEVMADMQFFKENDLKKQNEAK
jgi:hypothetical protein